MSPKIRPEETSESTAAQLSDHEPSTSQGVTGTQDSIEQETPEGGFSWIKSLISPLYAFFRDLFTSSEEESPNEEMQEENKPMIITLQEHDAIISQDLTAAVSHFKQMTDRLAQLRLLNELMKEERVAPSYINDLVHHYPGKQVIFDRMKQLLETHDLVNLTDKTTVQKETYLQMDNETLFGKFPKSTLAMIAISQLIQEGLDN